MTRQTPALRALDGADLPACLALSGAAGWNQNEADWRLLFDFGRGWGIEIEDGSTSAHLVASVIAFAPWSTTARSALSVQSNTSSPAPAGISSEPNTSPPVPGARPFAWISMVLVLPAYRGQGFASRLLRHVIEQLRREDVVPLLDASPEGHPVYRRLGFHDTWGFRRYRREALTNPEPLLRFDPRRIDPSAIEPHRTRAIGPRDWPAIRALDQPAFGADRGELLAAFAQRQPRLARLAEIDGRITGYVLGRDGRDCVQIGPLYAQDDAAALALLDDALAVLAATPGTAVCIDLADRHLALLEPLIARGFILQRPFSRMILDPAEPRAVGPGRPDSLVLMAGPEFG